MNTNKEKRFYIGTMPEYQLARANIKDGFGCCISCRKAKNVLPVLYWSVPMEALWNRRVQNSLSFWMTQCQKVWPTCTFTVSRTSELC